MQKFAYFYTYKWASLAPYVQCASVICNCQVNVSFVLVWRHITSVFSWNILVCNNLLSRDLINNWLFVITVIDHTQERLTAHHKWMPGASSISRNWLEEYEIAAIPLVNKRFVAVVISIFVVGKGEECCTIDVKGLHIPCSIRLKRLILDKAFPWPLEYRGFNRMPLFGAAIVCKNNVSYIVYYKRGACFSFLGSYLLKRFEVVVLPFVNGWVCTVRVRNGEKQFLEYFKEIKASCSNRWNVLEN